MPETSIVDEILSHPRYGEALESLDNKIPGFDGVELEAALLWEIVKFESQDMAMLCYVRQGGVTVHYVSCRTPGGRYHHGQDPSQVAAICHVLSSIWS